MRRYRKKNVLNQNTAEKQKINTDLYGNNDVPNAASHLGIRLFYTVLAWIVLANGVSKDAFMVSACLFTMPIVMDCIKFTPTNSLRKYIIRFEIFLSVLWLFVFLLGIFNVLVVKECAGVLVMTNAESFIGFEIPMIPICSIWRWMLSLVFITAVDWICQFMGVDTGGEKNDVY